MGFIDNWKMQRQVLLMATFYDLLNAKVIAQITPLEMERVVKALKTHYSLDSELHDVDGINFLMRVLGYDCAKATLAIALCNVLANGQYRDTWLTASLVKQGKQEILQICNENDYMPSLLWH